MLSWMIQRDVVACGMMSGNPSYREIGDQKDYAVFGHCVIQCP